MRSGTSFLVFIILLIANAAVFLNRDNFLYHKQVSYNQLYPLLTDVPVKEITKQNDSTLVFNLAAPSKGKVKWYISAENNIDSFSAADPFIMAREGLHHYKLFSTAYPDTLSASAEYIPAKHNNGAAFLGLYQTSTSSQTVVDIINLPGITEETDAGQLSALKKIISDSIRITSALSTEQKAERICIFLHQKIFDARGTPDEETLSLNAFDSYLAACSGKKIWCGIYARIFNLFATQAGIKSRTVEMSSRYENVTGPVHEFNEYFSPEKKQWIAVDVMFDHVRTVSSSGKIFNAAQVKNADHDDSTIMVVQTSVDSLINVPFNRSEQFFFDLYGKEKDLFFYRCSAAEYNGSLLTRAKNYITPSYWYEFYSDSNVANNRNYYTKEFLLVLLLISGIFTVAVFLKRLFKKNDRI